MKLTFMAMVASADPQEQRSMLSDGFVEPATQLVANMDQATDMAKQLAGYGCGVI